jgi:flagellar hook-length control protein FliK
VDPAAPNPNAAAAASVVALDALAAPAPTLLDARAGGDVGPPERGRDADDASVAPAAQAVPAPGAFTWAGAAASAQTTRPADRAAGDAPTGRTMAVTLPSMAARPSADATRAALGERAGERSSERTGERSAPAGEPADGSRDRSIQARTGDAPGRGFAPLRLDADAPSPAPGSTAVQVAAVVPADAPRVNAPAESTAPFAAQGLAGALPAAPLSTPSAAVPYIELGTAVTAPQFREAFALQVSHLARDGIQHAVLQLNPAEMGPISVQIALDGQQAQIHFGCDSALTRGIVENGMPLLAASLREAGLTLSGGGVSQHAPEQRQGSNPGGAPPERAFTAEPDRAATVGTLRVSAGRLDTYA